MKDGISTDSPLLTSRRKPYTLRSKRREKPHVTVCVAAMCRSPLKGKPFVILGAADRMLTVGSTVEFEPPQTKIVNLTSCIKAMTAGDAGIQAEICNRAFGDVNRRIQVEPKNWWLVRDVAQLWSDYYQQLRFDQAEAAILKTVGLDRSTFISRQRELAPELVRQLKAELDSFEIGAADTIIAGVDATGAHIYTVSDSIIVCHDLSGFVAVGIGGSHAQSEFMFAKHTKHKMLPETCLLTYAAKKRAEVAPGVGEVTDMFMIGPFLGNSVDVGPDVLDKLDAVYQKTLVGHAKVDGKAKKDAFKLWRQLKRENAARQQEAKQKTKSTSSTVSEPPSSQSQTEPKA